MRGAAGPLEGMRVLLVEDVPDIREVFGILLQMEGADVVAASTGHEAVAHLRREAFDLVLTDLGLPDVPGELVIRRAALAQPRPWIVVVTGYGEPYLSAARQAGANTVLTKPTMWSTLLARLIARDAPAVPTPSSLAA